MKLLKQEKKDNMVAKQKYLAIVGRNKKINKANIAILAVGLLLTFIDYKEVGNQVIWLGIMIFVYTLGSNIIARSGMRKAR